MAKSIRQLPLVIDIPTPCQADWNAMTGDARVRHCALCNKDVHALSELDEANVVSLLERGDVCVRLQVESDGAIAAKDRQPGRRAARVVATAALAALAACSAPDPIGETHSTGAPLAPPEQTSAQVAPTSSAPVIATAPTLTGAPSAAAPKPPPTFIKHTMGKPMAPRTLGGAIKVVHPHADPLAAPDLTRR